MKYKIDLNCDLGESFGNYNLGFDNEVIKFVSSVNIACGFHAGDPMVMDKTVKLAKENRVSVGAHPGYLDLLGFGRRNMDVSPFEVKTYVQYQIGALKAFCDANNISLTHVKPHGALYNTAGKNIELAKAICEAIYKVDKNLILLALSGSKMIDAANDIGLNCASEVFADRAYNDDGSLVPRTNSGAMITDENEAIDRVIKMIKYGKVTSVNGNEVNIEPNSICVHGDSPKALAFVKKINESLALENIEIVSLDKVIN